MRKKLVLRLPPPHPLQALIEQCAAKRIVVNAGRRAGKTYFASRKSILRANAGRRVLYCAPVFSQTQAYWDRCVEWLGPAIAVGLVRMNVTKRSLLFIKSGGRIVAKTASRPDHLRGDYGDYMIFDEYAYQDPEVWEKVGVPMLLDNDGDADFYSTPMMRNHFFLMGLKAQENADGRWAFFSFPSTSNPFLSAAAIAEISKDMTELDYRQEILAEFVEGEGQIFRPHRDDFLPAPKWATMVAEHKGHRIVAGMDWGRLHDFSALSIGCATCSKELLLKRWQKEDYPTQRDIVKGLYTRLAEANMAPEILSEENSMGLPNIEQLRQDGVPVTGILVTNAIKGQLVQGIRLAFEQRSWKWIWDEAAWRELEGFQAKVTQTGNITYFAPELLHDDTIVGRYLMLYQAKTGTFTLGTMGVSL
jgi:hypothetical protein